MPQNTELCELRNYLISRLLWDPTLDDHKLVHEFVTLHYGRAADKVQAYLSLIGETARRSGIHQGCFGSAAGYGIDAAVACQALKLTGRRQAAAENEEVKQRVEKVSIAARTVLIEPFARWIRTHNHRSSRIPGLRLRRRRTQESRASSARSSISMRATA